MRGGSAQARRPAQTRGRRPTRPPPAVASRARPPSASAASLTRENSRPAPTRIVIPRAGALCADSHPRARKQPLGFRKKHEVYRIQGTSKPLPPSARLRPAVLPSPSPRRAHEADTEGQLPRRIDTFRQKNGIARPHFAHKGSRERYDGGQCLQNQTGSARNAHGAFVSPQALRQRSVRAARRTELASHEKSPASGTTQGRASSGETAVRSRQTRRRVRSEASEAGFSSQTSGRPGSPKRKPNCVERTKTEGRRSSKRDKSPRRPTREHSARPNEPPREP